MSAQLLRRNLSNPVLSEPDPSAGNVSPCTTLRVSHRFSRTISADESGCPASVTDCTIWPDINSWAAFFEIEASHMHDSVTRGARERLPGNELRRSGWIRSASLPAW